ncbi:ABC transporter substrate-binding protein (plasmid) [Haloferax sp. S1W]|uniref:ABC transporter substrate-binding protein n=1 Tax=Haloferax sp. S1W TaxID=3377110 RepID=UPI0037C7DFC6
MSKDIKERIRLDRRKFMRVAGASTTTAMLAGCTGNGGSTTNSPNTGNSGSGTETGETNNSSGAGDSELSVIWPGGINNINPLGWLTIPDYDAVRMMYEPLTSVDDKARAIGHVADSWETSDDGATYTWYIKEGITWHDGEPLTAEDVAFTFKTIKEYEWPYLGSLSSVIADPSEITVEDEYTVVTPLTQPYAPLPLVLADLGMVIPKHIWSEFDNPADETNTENPIGSGPFKFENRQQDQYLKFSVDDNYWGEAPDYDKAVVKIVSSTDSQILNMKQGNGDMLRLQPGQYVSDVENSGNLSVVEAGSTYVTYLGINTSREMLSDKALRQAMAYALDRDTIAELVVGGYATPGYSPIPPGLEYYHNPDSNSYKHNLEQARTILEDNGYTKQGNGRVGPNGNPVEFTLSIPNTGNWPRIAEVLARQLGEVGITINVDSMESNAHDQKVTVEHDYDLSLNTWRVWFDPDPFLSPVFEEMGSLNTTEYESAEFDELMKQQRRATDTKERQQILYDAQDILTEEVPWVVLFYPQLLHAVRSEAWKNFNPIPRYGMQSPYGLKQGTGPIVKLDPK